MLNRAGIYGDEGLWIRKAYREGILKRSITAVLRPGDRSNPSDYTHIRQGVPVVVRFIVAPGEAKVGQPGNLMPDDGTTVIRTKCIVKPIKDVTEEDLHGCAPDHATPELVRYHLAVTYNTALPSWDDVVTIWHFEYAPNAIE
ncbi:MAG: hypothetical protein NUW00_04275 [Candidatus Kaiserbacteria bacterium]|nr:hypothetical protein [Candidatus Kaiserbacteria bacterium]